MHKLIISARSELLFASQGRGRGPRTLALRARQRFVYRELTERVIMVIVTAVKFGLSSERLDSSDGM